MSILGRTSRFDTTSAAIARPWRSFNGKTGVRPARSVPLFLDRQGRDKSRRRFSSTGALSRKLRPRSSSDAKKKPFQRPESYLPGRQRFEELMRDQEREIQDEMHKVQDGARNSGRSRLARLQRERRLQILEAEQELVELKQLYKRSLLSAKVRFTLDSDQSKGIAFNPKYRDGTLQKLASPGGPLQIAPDVLDKELRLESKIWKMRISAPMSDVGFFEKIGSSIRLLFCLITYPIFRIPGGLFRFLLVRKQT